MGLCTDTYLFSCPIHPTRSTGVCFPFRYIMQEWFSFQATDGFDGWLKVVYKRGWKCTFTHLEFILGALLMHDRHNFSGLRRRGELRCRKGQPTLPSFPGVDPEL